ncbi:MAG: bifunctional phosphoglucose/phosphomannose isomerase [Candidatus Thorarchaeota archaeon]
MVQVDTNDMRSMVSAFPNLLTEISITPHVWKTCEKLREGRIDGICIIGMGGSSISGLYVQSLLQDSVSIPIINVRETSIPSYIQKDWLVIAVSYSGNTFETIRSLQEALKRKCKSFVITSGGKLHSIKGVNEEVTLPSSYQPRAALPLIFSALLNLVEILTMHRPTDFTNVSEKLSDKVANWEMSEFSPKSMAADLLGYIPVFIGSQHLVPVAYRAKSQINENAKAMAFSSELPEANHNEIESFNSSNLDSVIPVFLRSSYETDSMRKSTDNLMQIYEEEGFPLLKLAIRSDSKIEEMLMFTFYLDLVSIELAELRGVNPLSVDKITKLKSMQ